MKENKFTYGGFNCEIIQDPESLQFHVFAEKGYERLDFVIDDELRANSILRAAIDTYQNEKE